MNYQTVIEINAPREKIVETFLNIDALQNWQPSLVNFELMQEGDPNKVGAKMKQTHNMNGRVVEMVQTITKMDPPEFFSATYEADKVWNLIDNQFIALDDTTTRWVVDNEFKCGGFIAVLAFLFPGMFKKQTQQFMSYFKDYVEQKLAD